MSTTPKGKKIEAIKKGFKELIDILDPEKYPKATTYLMNIYLSFLILTREQK